MTDEQRSHDIGALSAGLALCPLCGARTTQVEETLERGISWSGPYATVRARVTHRCAPKGAPPEILLQVTAPTSAQAAGEWNKSVGILNAALMAGATIQLSAGGGGGEEIPANGKHPPSMAVRFCDVDVIESALAAGVVAFTVVGELSPSAFVETPTDAQLADACLWCQHDFGLLDDEQRRQRMFSMREHWRAIWKAVHTPGRGGVLTPPGPSAKS